MLDELIMHYRSRVLLTPQTLGGGAVQAYLKPTAGVQSIVVRAVFKVGTASADTLSLKYADDATGTNAAAFSAAGAIFKDGVAQTAAKTFGTGTVSSNQIIDFIVDPALVVQDKFVGLAVAGSSASNLISATLIEKMGVQPTAT